MKTDLQETMSSWYMESDRMKTISKLCVEKVLWKPRVNDMYMETDLMETTRKLYVSTDSGKL